MSAQTVAAETPQQAARRLSAGAIRDGFKPQALHLYSDENGAPLFWRIRLKNLETGDKWIRPMRVDDGAFVMGEPAFDGGKPLYRLHELAGSPDAPVFVVEGESAADALARLGVAATTSGGADSAAKADWSPLAGRAVTVWPDNDAAGQRYGSDVAERLASLGCTVSVIDAVSLGLLAKGDAVDWLAAHPVATAADVWALPAVEAEGEPPPMHARCLADVQAEPVHWLWPGRIARGKVTVLAGHPGLGKSQLCASLAAVITAGGLWPVDRTRAGVGAVAILSAEDDAADTLKPRLLAAGADVRRVHVLDAVRCLGRDGKPAGRTFDLAADVAALAGMLERLGDVAMLVIDPITAYLGGVDSHRNAEVRGLLAPLSDMAARLGVAVVCVTHLNKSGGADALARVTGSLAFVAAARAAWIVAKDPQDPARRLFLPAKNNLGPDSAGLAFGIESATVEDGIETSRLVWHAETVTMTASEALATEQGPDRREDAPQRDEVEAWLAEQLAVGPVATEDLQRRARADGVAWATVRRAKDALGAKARRHGFGAAGKWIWELPEGTEGIDGHHRCPSTETVSTFDESKAGIGFATRVSSKALTNSGAEHLSGKGEHLRPDAGRPCTASEYQARREWEDGL